MRKFFLTGLLLISMCNGFAQTDPAQLRFHFLGVKDGLPEGSVNTLLQDAYGYIWVGTQNGLVRYDGYQPKVYDLQIRNNISVNVKSIFEDRKGRLWIGCFGNSLFCYDRSQDAFVSYVLNVPAENAGDDYLITSLTDDGQGNLWFALINITRHFSTIVSFNLDTRTFRNYNSHTTGSHYVGDDNILSIATTGNGVLLAGGKKGLYQYDSVHDRFIRCNARPDSLVQKRIILLSADKTNEDAMWLASGDPNRAEKTYDHLILYHVKTGILKSYSHQPHDTSSFPGTSINSVYSAADGRIWIGSDAGLTEFSKATNRFITYLPDDVKRSNVFLTEVEGIQEDGKGNLWCVTNDGLLLFNVAGRHFKRYTYDPKSNNNIVESNVRSLMVARDGTVWFGAAQLGLQWANISSSKFIQYQSNQSLRHYFPGGAVNEAAESGDGTIWLSTDIGLYQWRSGTDSFVRIQLGKHAADDYYSTSVMVDDEGLVWSRATATNIGIMGLYCYDPKTKKAINYRYQEGDSTSLSNNNIRSLCQDHTGGIWAGTFGGGICRFDKQKRIFKRYPYINSIESVISTGAAEKTILDDDEVQIIYEDKSGDLWAGTNNGSLNRLDRETDRFIPYQKPIVNMQCVISLMSAGAGRLWVGTYTNGVYLVDTRQNSYTVFSETNGLQYNGSWGMQYDNSGHLWLASPRGLSVLSPDKKIQNLTAAAGLPSEPLNFFIFKQHNGYLLYGTRDGFIVFNPDDIINNPLAPPVIHIENITFASQNNGQAHDSVIQAFGKKEVQLAYNENRLTISYVGLQYQNAFLTRYQYQLEGYDKGWIDAGTQRQVTYTNLSPGSYSFRVKAVNSDDVESKTFDSISIVISPPWWKTWWAYVLYVLLLIAAVWVFVVYRSRQLLVQNKLLEQHVTERTQQLNLSLTELKSTQAQLIQSEKMASLGELTAGIAHEIQNPLNFVNNFSELNKEMIAELKEEIEKANYDEVIAIAGDIEANEEKINQHGRRADAIVKGMLQHSRQSKGVKELTDLNALCDEFLRLSYHGLRAKDKSFNADFTTHFDESIGMINIVPQDMGRVLLNLFNNAFYAVNEKKRTGVEGYKPLVTVQTKKNAGKIEIRVEDNGGGIPQSIIDKIFQPFFTTKPTGQGTGLGLSLAYEIITKEHNGTLKVESKEGEGASFIITMPVSL